MKKLSNTETELKKSVAYKKMGTSLESKIFNVKTLEKRRFKKSCHQRFRELVVNGKLDDIVKQAHDEKENPFLNLPHGNASTTAYVCSVIEKNYPEVDALYSEYIKLEDCKEDYITSKIKYKYKTLFTPFNLKRTSDIITFIGMHVLNQLAD